MNLGDKNGGVSIAFFSIDHSIIYKVGKVQTYFEPDYLLYCIVNIHEFAKNL